MEELGGHWMFGEVSGGEKGCGKKQGLDIGGC